METIHLFSVPNTKLYIGYAIQPTESMVYPFCEITAPGYPVEKEQAVFLGFVTLPLPFSPLPLIFLNNSVLQPLGEARLGYSEQGTCSPRGAA